MTRYAIRDTPYDVEMVERKNGAWVRYADHQRALSVARSALEIVARRGCDRSQVAEFKCRIDEEYKCVACVARHALDLPVDIVAPER